MREQGKKRKVKRTGMKENWCFDSFDRKVRNGLKEQGLVPVVLSFKGHIFQLIWNSVEFLDLNKELTIVQFHIIIISFIH